MPDNSPVENEFLSQVTAVVENNMANEQFGVTELAAEMNMSRSNLLRKVKKVTNLSVSQLISQVRLKRGMVLLRAGSMNVSEVSHEVGFSSTSYFIKCFREYYGYPPGEVGKRPEQEDIVGVPPPRHRKTSWLWVAGSVLVIGLGAMLYFVVPATLPRAKEKSIAVLPFKNESNDSTNVYLINGLMESTLSNLQKIKDLKVISRTSSERYRNMLRTVPEMGRELHVTYFVEGSGQKIGDKILLNIQLIDAVNDKHLWAKQYRRDSKDIFELQQEIAKNIADEIQAVITPEEEKRIEKKPTEDLVAYDLFLKGRDLYFQGTTESFDKAIPYFKQAVERDPKFALAYAGVAMLDYYRDIFHTEQTHSAEMIAYADKAMLYDSKLAESLVAKAMVYMLKKDYESAVPYLEQALEYNPNSALVIHFLADLYNLSLPNAPKYLEYALKGLQLDVADSSTTSYTYLHVSNALVQTGFIDEALTYINKSLAYNPKNPFSGYLKPFILFAKSKDAEQTKKLLQVELRKDSNRVDVLTVLASVYYSTRDYDAAYGCYKKIIAIRESQHLDLFKNENLAMGIVYHKKGLHEKGDELIKSFKDFADHDRSLYKNLHLTFYYCYKNDVATAMKHLRLFSKEDNFQYWVLLLPNEPTLDPIKDLPEFKDIMRTIDKKFWDRHDVIKERLEEQGLL